MASTADEYKAEGNRAFRNCDFQAAVTQFSESLKLNPNDALVFGNRAAAYEKLGQFEKSAEDAQAALRVDPTYLKGYFRMATSMLQLNRPQEAAAAEEFKVRGNNEYKAKSYSSAHRLYTEAVKLAPTNATYLINRAAAALMLERATDALADCQAALDVEPTLIKAHVRASKALVQLGQISDARRQLELAATLATADGTIAPELATLSELESSIRTAKEALTQDLPAAHREALRLATIISERCPQSEEMACLQMEALLKAQPKHGAAQVVAQSARWLRISSDNPDLLCVRGKGLYASGQLDAALKHFSEALRLDPDHRGSKQMRTRLKEFERAKKAGNDAFAAGRYAEAIELYSDCLLLDPENIDLNMTLYTNRATARFKAGEFSAAIDDCNAALDAQPRHLKALLRRAACKLELEQYQNAIEDYEAAHEIQPDDQSIKQSIRHAKLEYKKSQRKDLYKLLGTTKAATDHEIKKAYKKMALQCHPDRLTNASDDEKKLAEAKFKEVGEAFEILSDPQKKQQWDQGMTLDEINGNGGGGRGGGGGGIDPSDIFRMYTQGRGGGFPGGF